MALLAVVVVVGAGCGSGAHSGGSSPSTTSTRPSPTNTGTPGAATNGALLAEAQSAAAGDIPDNQVFLTYRDPGKLYALRYPEGWNVGGSPALRTISDKNNVIRIAVSRGNAPTVQSIRAEMGALATATPSLSAGAIEPRPSCQNGASHPKVRNAAYHVAYSDRSEPSPVTGKRSTLLVDRYYFYDAAGGHVVVIDFGTPKGVDNVDAYCQIAVSFSWM